MKYFSFEFSLHNPQFQPLIITQLKMSESDEEGFHQSSIQMFTIKTRHFHEIKQTKIRNKNTYLYRSPLSLHHQLQLYEYPRQLDFLNEPKKTHIPINANVDYLSLVRNDGQMPILLSEFFPKKLNCVYNRFRENFILKRDTTILIRNIANRIRNDQIITFHERNDPPTNNNSLLFNSNFEGGNLHCVFRQKSNGCYFLLLQNDINTHGFTIWFHFNVKAYQAGTYHFVISNLAKEIHFQGQTSLLTFSSINNQYERVVRFQCEQTKFRHCQSLKRFWSIHFQYTFQQNEDVYFSLCSPYTFSKLLRLLKQVTQPFYNSFNAATEIVGKSELGNYIPCLKLASKQKPSKNCIIITARQHPCETVGSFVCEEIIRIITENTSLTHELLQAFTFYIIPMVNPDGVIHGNSRTNLMGYDINRSWDINSLIQTAQTTQIWEYILKIIEEDNQIAWTFDLHGHSKQLGYFAYFCQQNQNNLILNHFLNKKGKYYDRQKCGFNLNRGKRESIRGQFFTKFKISTAVTIQTSYYGFRDENGAFIQYNQSHFHQIALQILQSINQTKKALNDKNIKNDIIQEISKNSHNWERKLKIYHHSLELDSDSDPEEDYLLKEERTQVNLASNCGKNALRLRTKTQYKNQNRLNLHSGFTKQRQKVPKNITKEHYTSLKKSGTSQKEKEKSLTFYAGRRTFSPHSLKKSLERSKLRRKIDVHRHIKSQMSDHIQDEQFQYLKKSFEIKKHLKQQEDSKKQKTHVGGFRTCYEVFGLRTIVYPTAASAGIDFQNSLKSKKQIIKEIRNRQIGGKRISRRKLSQNFYNQMKKKI